MYRRSKSLEAILEVRQQMARDADFDVDLYVEMVRAGSFPTDRQPASIENDRDGEDPEVKAA